MDDILWVLTVPAIWDDAAKAFMKEAAKLVAVVNLLYTYNHFQPVLL